MARDGNGTYNRTQSDYVFDTVIEEAKVNSELNDIATALTGSLAKDGQTNPTANLPMAGFKHTGVGNASARTDYAAAGQVTDGALVYAGVAGGTADALTVTLTPAVTALVTGMQFLFKASANSNTAAATMAINGLSTVAIEKNDSALSGGDIAANKWYMGVYDGTALQITRLSTVDGYSDPLTTRGDVVVRGASSTDRLALGTTGHVLQSDGTDTVFGQVVAAGIATDAVETAKIQDNAVTLAKQAGGTAGAVSGWDGSGNPAEIAPNTAGFVLTDGGVGVAPTMQALPSTGAWVKLGTAKTASASSSINFESADGFDPSTYDEFMIKYVNYVASAAGTTLKLRFGTGGTPTYQSGASDYSWGMTTVDTITSAGAAVSANETDSGIDVAFSSGSTTSQGNFGTINIFGAQNTDDYPGVTFQGLCGQNGTNRRTAFSGGGDFNNVHGAIVAVTAVQLVPSTGTITSGEFVLFGIAY